MHIDVKENFVEEGSNKTDEEYYTTMVIPRAGKGNDRQYHTESSGKAGLWRGLQGYCPKCGADLNNDECKCVNEDIDPRLEVFKTFLQTISVALF